MTKATGKPRGRPPKAPGTPGAPPIPKLSRMPRLPKTDADLKHYKAKQDKAFYLREVHTGDAYSLAVRIYQHPDIPLEIRMKAMAMAGAYERPALSRVQFLPPLPSMPADDQKTIEGHLSQPDAPDPAEVWQRMLNGEKS